MKRSEERGANDGSEERNDGSEERTREARNERRKQGAKRLTMIIVAE